jgi:hypothetical protein
MKSMISVIVLGLLMLLLAPLIGHGAAYIVTTYGLPHLVGFYIVIVLPICYMLYVIYHVSKNMDS